MKDTILWDRESDRYTERASQLHGGDLYGNEVDLGDAKRIAAMLPRRTRIRSILDIGCGYGALSAAVARTFPHASVLGIDPGGQSIASARRALRDVPNLRFRVGYSHAIPSRDRFDLVVLRMVLQWIPRAQLLQTLAEIDRSCDGFVFIQDFYPSKPATSVSVHNKDVRIFKQDYPAIFESVPFYKLIHREIEDAELGDDFCRGKFMLQKLPLEASYEDRRPVQEKDKPTTRRAVPRMPPQRRGRAARPVRRR